VGGEVLGFGLEEAERFSQVAEGGVAVRAGPGGLALAEAERRRLQMLPGQLDLPRDRVDPLRRRFEPLVDRITLRFHAIRQTPPWGRDEALPLRKGGPAGPRAGTASRPYVSNPEYCLPATAY
jgi:hypothetical protein